ncbi:MAG TPA: cysteine--tRNA ligase [Acidimicrobiales bacterium]|nr:cysteine--tRNA ligase [Acidimicrobiales bacterium]
MLRLHDTATGRVDELVTRDPGHVGLYVCGSTVYGPPHAGHGRFALVYDVLRRYLRYRGLRVHFVSNVTDLDDKILDRARAERRDWRDVATEWEGQWWSALDRMGVERPDDDPHATAYIPEMVELVDDLVRAGAAYETSDGVYLEVERVPGYGLLAHQDLGSLRAGARVALNEEKRSPLDFALWKKAKPGEPTWPSPYGDGRPGWHTECVVMALALLGEDFDLHGGGQDLMFPHHENERAQAVALGRGFARHWVHNGLVTVGGEKMSKSLGNFTTLADLLAENDPRAYRLLVVQSGYRSPLEITGDLLQGAASAVGRIDSLDLRMAGADRPAPDAPGSAEADALVRLFEQRMDDDLDTTRAVAALFEGVRRANALLDAGDAAAGIPLAHAALACFAVLGLHPRGGEVGPDARVGELMARRDAARDARDFAAADALRDEIEALGWKVEDTREGTRVHR